MKDLLSAAHRGILHRLGSDPKAVLAFDFDGTLVGLYRDPQEVHMAASTRTLLRCLCRSHRVVLITGRGLEDIEPKVKGIGFLGIVGSHGMEWTFGPNRVDRFIARTRRWKEALESAFRSKTSGILVEDKRFSLSVHWRQARKKTLAARQVKREIQKLSGTRLIGGKEVMNVLPKGAPDKGIAFRRVLRKLGAETAFYIGDDVTDEYIFRLTPPRGAHWVLVKVGNANRTHAGYRLKSQKNIDAVLRELIKGFN
jgi:trehalose 6-phosphate phosphatase